MSYPPKYQRQPLMIRLLSQTAFASVLVSALFTYKANASSIQGTAAQGKEKIQMCAGCHSIEGWHAAFPRTYRVPRIGGQHAAYIKKALEEYKSGERSHPTMRAIASSLSEQDMADLAAFYAEQPTPNEH